MNQRIGESKSINSFIYFCQGSKNSHISLSNIHIVLPVYNPIDGWAENVIQRFKALEKACLSIAKLHLVIVNDGSVKGNLTEGKEMIQKEIIDMHWIQNDLNRGKGFALRKGVEIADSEYIIFTDIDFPYTESSMLDLINQLISGDYDAVIGTRDNSYYNSLPASRKRISFLLKNLNAKLLGLKIADTQGGLKGFTKKIKPVFLQTEIDRYLFDLEFIYLLSRKESYRLLPLEVKLREGVEFSKVRFSILFSEFQNFLKVWWSTRRI